MIKGKHLLVIMILAIGSLLFMASRVAASYSFSVDRFQVFGNLPNGNFDEFNDGVLTPWSIEEGTVLESSGMLTLSSPGNVEIFSQDNLEVTQERSGAEVSATTGAFAVADGSGDFTVESRWSPVVPDVNEGYGMTFHYPPSEFDQVRIGFDNPDALNLSWLGAPAGTLPGTYIMFLQISPEPGTDPVILNFEYQAVPVDTDDITGDIVFQLIFYDADNSFSAAYSLDGGSTFLQPFSPFSISSLNGSRFVELEAGSTNVYESNYSRYDFNFYYNDGSGDYYTGYVYAPTSFQTNDLQFAVGKKLYEQPMEFWASGYQSFNGSYYEITEITDGFASSYDKKSYITAYYDADTAHASLEVNSDGSATAASIYIPDRTVAWETGYAISGTNNDTFSVYEEADVSVIAALTYAAATSPTSTAGSVYEEADVPLALVSYGSGMPVNSSSGMLNEDE